MKNDIVNNLVSSVSTLINDSLTGLNECSCCSDNINFYALSTYFKELSSTCIKISDELKNGICENRVIGVFAADSNGANINPSLILVSGGICGYCPISKKFKDGDYIYVSVSSSVYDSVGARTLKFNRWEVFDGYFGKKLDISSKTNGFSIMVDGKMTLLAIYDVEVNGGGSDDGSGSGSDDSSIMLSSCSQEEVDCSYNSFKDIFDGKSLEEKEDVIVELVTNGKINIGQALGLRSKFN